MMNLQCLYFPYSSSLLELLMKNRAKDRHHQLMISFVTHQGLLISPLLSLALAHYANEPLHKTLPMNYNEDVI